MALVTPPCSEIQKQRKTATMIHKKPLLLKDFLMDDLSSSSSSGFKSFPRRQCCTTVRSLLDIDLKSSSRPQLPPPKSIHNHNNFKSKNQKQILRRSRSRATAATTLSALQRASGAVIKAVRSLQFHSFKSSTSLSVQSSARKGGLVLLRPRSISRRLWTNSFRDKVVVEEEEKDVRRWRSFWELLQEEDKASDQTTASTKSTDSKTNSSSWRESEFSLNSSESSIGINDVAEVKTSLLPETEKVSGRVGVTAGEDSIETPTTTTNTSTCSPQNAKVWLNKEEKEQFSPVSVLDCPFEDEDDESSNSCPFRCRLARMEGAQHKFMQKIRRFENLALLEPIDLDRQMAMTEVDDEDDRDSDTEKEVVELVKQLIIETSSSALSGDMVVRMKADKLVVDLFIDMISVENSKENVVMMEEVLKVAEEWVSGESQMLSSWEVEYGRQVYVNAMDNKHCGKWMELDEQEKEVGLELEVEIWNSLLYEFLLDLVSSIRDSE